MNAADVRAIRNSTTRRYALLITALSTALIAMMLIRVLLGQYTVTIPDFLRILNGDIIPGATFIVLQDKLPRTLLGAAAGMAFGISGALFRSVLRNPLASPDVLGINSGAATGAVIATYFWAASGTGLAWAALCGAGTAAAAIAITSMTRHSGTGTLGIAGERFVLAGIGIAALANAITAGLMARMHIYSAQTTAIWTTGSLNSSTWERLALLMAVFAVAAPAALLIHQFLQPTSLGTELAMGLGARPSTTQAWALCVGVVLAATATAATGPLSFVALLSTPVAAALRGGKISCVASGIVGAFIVVAADMVSSEMLGEIRMPAGVITGAIGAPMMLWLLIQMRNGRKT